MFMVVSVHTLLCSGFADDELTKQKVDSKQVFDVGREGPSIEGQNQWPASLPAFRETVMVYFDECSDLSRCGVVWGRCVEDKCGFVRGIEY